MCIPAANEGFDNRRLMMMGLARRGLQILMAELGLDLFRQPALEMLFELYSKPADQTHSLTGLSSVTSTSERNSQRIVHRMEELTLVETVRDATDGRRTVVRLTDAGRQAIEAFLDDWASSAEFRAMILLETAGPQASAELARGS
ncbi:MarR family winged helix-turn-helix transcriptional regulator [Novosphingobium sp. KA1]|uniref:MarR family winged helix-turn-helix transcriptional regulator n=1 Tax=Novosphingobium sp. (strain KA1) TaxID=164608 RepID=UPI001A8E01E0|nr:MarR family winged helix-turn-helix transcriptional regulator [Novosphingobium sp. KA1]QSR19720.1 hypothetical protein CA833_21490 [Novosphingobium sp. KA1]